MLEIALQATMYGAELKLFRVVGIQKLSGILFIQVHKELFVLGGQL